MKTIISGLCVHSLYATGWYVLLAQNMEFHGHIEGLFWFSSKLAIFALYIRVFLLTQLSLGHFVRITRPWQHSLNTNFDLEDFPYMGCGFTVRFDFFLNLHASFLGFSFFDSFVPCCNAALDGFHASIIYCGKEGFSK